MLLSLNKTHSLIKLISMSIVVIVILLSSLEGQKSQYLSNEARDSIDAILSFEAKAARIQDDYERAVFYYDVINEINNFTLKLDEKFEIISTKYIDSINVIEKKLRIPNYKFFDNKPNFKTEFTIIPVTQTSISSNIHEVQAKLIKSQYIKTYSAYKDLIENFKQYISILDEVERSRDILKDPESIKNYLEVTLETRYYSDYNALMKGFNAFSNESNLGKMKVSRNNQGSILSIEWSNEADTLTRIREFSYYSDGLLESIKDKIDGKVYFENFFGNNDISNKFYQYIFSDSFKPLHYDHMTEIYYDSDFRIIAYRFLTLNGDLIGSIYKTYNTKGNLMRELWTQGHDDRVVREFSSSYDDSNNSYRIIEIGKGGKLIRQEIITNYLGNDISIDND